MLVVAPGMGAADGYVGAGVGMGGEVLSITGKGAVDGVKMGADAACSHRYGSYLAIRFRGDITPDFPQRAIKYL